MKMRSTMRAALHVAAHQRSTGQHLWVYVSECLSHCGAAEFFFFQLDTQQFLRHDFVSFLCTLGLCPPRLRCGTPSSSSPSPSPLFSPVSRFNGCLCFHPDSSLLALYFCCCRFLLLIGRLHVLPVLLHRHARTLTHPHTYTHTRYNADGLQRRGDETTAKHNELSPLLALLPRAHRHAHFLTLSFFVRVCVVTEQMCLCAHVVARL
jgi:hypothetical protein